MFQYTIDRRVTMSEQGKQAAKIAAMLAGGAILGAGLGLLFAPKAGAQTRRDLGRYAKKAQVQALRLGRSVQSGVKEAIDRRNHAGKNCEEPSVLSAALN
jgi:gas vesicle protein